MKPEAKRLMILDVLILLACLLEWNIGLTRWMWLPAFLSQLILLGYGLWLLACRWGKGELSS
jgi:hypothetical protein